MIYAMGNTREAAMNPWIAPNITFPIATNDTGRGARTLSSISLVYPNSLESGNATAWIPWNIMESPTTPEIKTDANID